MQSQTSNNTHKKQPKQRSQNMQHDFSNNQIQSMSSGHLRPAGELTIETGDQPLQGMPTITQMQFADQDGHQQPLNQVQAQMQQHRTHKMQNNLAKNFNQQNVGPQAAHQFGGKNFIGSLGSPINHITTDVVNINNFHNYKGFKSTSNASFNTIQMGGGRVNQSQQSFGLQNLQMINNRIMGSQMGNMMRQGQHQVGSSSHLLGGPRHNYMANAKPQSKGSIVQLNKSVKKSGNGKGSVANVKSQKNKQILQRNGSLGKNICHDPSLQITQGVLSGNSSNMGSGSKASVKNHHLSKGRYQQSKLGGLNNLSASHGNKQKVDIESQLQNKLQNSKSSQKFNHPQPQKDSQQIQQKVYQNPQGSAGKQKTAAQGSKGSVNLMGSRRVNKFNKLQKPEKIVLGDHNSQGSNMNSINFDDENDLEDESGSTLIYDVIKVNRKNMKISSKELQKETNDSPVHEPDLQSPPSQEEHSEDIDGDQSLPESPSKQTVDDDQNDEDISQKGSRQGDQPSREPEVAVNPKPTVKQSIQIEPFQQQDKQFIKTESENMHKLIKDLNEQAMAILYAQGQQNICKESVNNEYLVIQRKLSEIKQTALEPDNYDQSDIQKSIKILEKAQKILIVQREKGQLKVKPIFSSIIDYNIACCNQQVNNLKQCDRLLGQSIQFLLQDINMIDQAIDKVNKYNQKQRNLNQKISQNLQIGLNSQKNLRGSFSGKKLSCDDHLSLGDVRKNYKERDYLASPSSQLVNRRDRSGAPLSKMNGSGNSKPNNSASFNALNRPVATHSNLRASNPQIQISPLRTKMINNLQKTQACYHPVSLYYLKYTRQRQQSVLMLQHCAILSQLNRHQDALDISKATALLIKEITQLAAHIIKIKRENYEEKERRRRQIVILEEIEDQESRGCDPTSSSIMGKSISIGGFEGRRSRATSKKERGTRGIEGRKQSFSQYTSNKLSGGVDHKVSGSSKLKTSMDTNQIKIGRQNSESKTSMRSVSRGSKAGGLSRAYSRSLSEMSRATNKSIKSINASLERIHTFGMSSVHKSKYDIEKIDDQYDSMLKDKKEKEGGENNKIQKTASLTKLQSAISQNLNSKDEKQVNNDSKEGKGNKPVTSLKFMDPKSIENNEEIDEQNSPVGPAIKKNKQMSKVSSSMNYDKDEGLQLLEVAQGEGAISQSLAVSTSKTGKKVKGRGAEPTDEDLKLPDNYSSINSISDNQQSKLAQNTQTSYYVRDQFQPLKSHQTNIEKLLVQFKDLQQQFTDVVFQQQLSAGGAGSAGGHMVSTNTQGAENIQSDSSAILSGGISSEVIKQLKMSFQSIEEIERLKKDSNMYKQTQRNQLGVAKNNSGPDGRKLSKLNWIDLFNIGNVMLMRGQDIQMTAQGMEIGEVDKLLDIANFEDGIAKARTSETKKDSKSKQSVSSSNNGRELPELSLFKCHGYSIGKDSFTEIVLLTVISYFCVSTEQRFMNMNSEKEKTVGSGSNNENTNRSMLNNSNQSAPQSSKSAGIQSASALNSTLLRSTKPATATSSQMRQLGSPPQFVRQNVTETRQINLSKGTAPPQQPPQPSKASSGSGGRAKVLPKQSSKDQASLDKEKEALALQQLQQTFADQQEYFLAKALHFGITYLPAECPLVQHLTQNYIKNYLQSKIDQREEMINRFIQ